MVLLSSDSSKAAASSAAFVSVDESKYTIILAARTQMSDTLRRFHQLKEALESMSACPTSQSVRYGVRVLAEVGLVEALCVAVSKQSGDLLLQNRSNHLGQLLAVGD